MSKSTQTVDQLEARLAELTKTNHQLQQKLDQKEQQLSQITNRHDTKNLLFKLASALNANPNIEAISQIAVDLAKPLRAAAAEIYLLTESCDTHFKSSHPNRETLAAADKQKLVIDTLNKGPAAETLTNKQPLLIANLEKSPYSALSKPYQQMRSLLCVPLLPPNKQYRGVLIFFHYQPDQFKPNTLKLLQKIIPQLMAGISNAWQITSLQSNLHGTELKLEISRRLSGTTTLSDVHQALVESIAAVGAEQCTLYSCDELDQNNIPTYTQISYFSHKTVAPNQEDIFNQRLPLPKYPALNRVVHTQEPLVVQNIQTDDRLDKERTLLATFGAQSVVINPLIVRGHVTGLLSIEYTTPHAHTKRELAIYRTLANQTTLALEHIQQIQRTEAALAETQTLYRAGRVLAGATDLQEVLQEALVEFVYSLGLQQGGITLLTPDRKFGQLKAYLEKGQLQAIDQLRFPIDETIPYQKLLLSGQPFISNDVPNDKRLAAFKSFNSKKTTTALLQAPIIVRGETVGWIGADALDRQREFTQREADLARAMADQIAITIQNHHLLEQTKQRAEQLKAVATVGEAVTGLMDLDEALNATVNLIRDRFGFYHVSIFLLDQAKAWAVVKASTGEVGKIMVERPHRLGVGSNSIVGYVTANATPRIALDVGQDAVHFNNPLLPETRSEMALPLISRGVVIGALDVQSVEANAFTDEDIETLQIMTDQLVSAIENARLFEQTQKTLKRTQTLYHISDALTTVTEQQATFEAVLGEYLKLLGLDQGSIMLFDTNTHTNVAYARFINGKPVEPNLSLPVQEDLVFQHLLDNPEPLVIEGAPNHPLTKEHKETRGQHSVTSMLFIPLMRRGNLVGSLVIDATGHYTFSQEDIEIGQAIAYQLNIWLENRQLLTEAHHRSDLLQTAAEVSRVASSILDVNELINSSVNLIRDQFGFYYVGLFLVDEANEWAVLKAGTGQAGRLQLEKKHRLKIGGESMIGWSMANKQARIALDVGSEAVHFKNPILPDTRSEMALPLISRDKAIGALTVQSIEQSAFSDEDITVLQTMADQLANAIENALLFAQTQQALAEAETLYQITQNLSSASDEEAVYQLVTGAIAGSGADWGAIYIYADSLHSAGAASPPLQQKAFWAGSGQTPPALPPDADVQIIVPEQIRWHEVIQIEDIESSPYLANPAKRLLTEQNTTTLLLLPLATYQNRLGVLLVANSGPEKTFTPVQVRFFSTIGRQVVISLENLRLLNSSQRRARREEIIREITAKIRNAVDIDDILKTTVTELSKVVGTSRGSITLDVSGDTPLLKDDHREKPDSEMNDNNGTPAGHKGSKSNGQ